MEISGNYTDKLSKPIHFSKKMAIIKYQEYAFRVRAKNVHRSGGREMDCGMDITR